MIIFAQPMYSKPQLNADSNYIVYSILIRAMREARPDWHWVIPFPDAKSGYSYDDDGFFRLPTVTRIPQRISPRKMANAISFSAWWYDEVFRRLAFDAVWTNLPEIAGPLTFAGYGSADPAGRPLIVAAHNYVIHETLPIAHDCQDHVKRAQVTGATLANVNIFNSDHCCEMLMDNARAFLSDRMLARLQETFVKINYGPLSPDLELARNENDPPVIAYNHRLQKYKNWRETMDLLQEMWDEGDRFRVLFLNNTKDKMSQLARYPFVEIALSRTHPEYLEKLRGCDLNVTNTVHETFCISAVESMALGQPIVAPNGITFPEITGRKDGNGYPYLFTSRKEQKAMLRRLLKSRAERHKWGEIVSRHVLSRYTTNVWAEAYARMFESKLADDRFQPNPAEDARDMLSAQAEACHGKTINDFLASVRNRPVNGRVPFASQSLPNTRALRILRAVGGSLVMRGGEQYVVAPRKEKPAILDAQA